MDRRSAAAVHGLGGPPTPCLRVGLTTEMHISPLNLSLRPFSLSRGTTLQPCHLDRVGDSPEHATASVSHVPGPVSCCQL